MTITIAMVRGMLDSIAKVIADLPGYLNLNRMALLPCYGDTDLPGYLVRALDRLLVALPVLLSVALGPRAIAIAWLSFGSCFRLSLSFTLPIPVSTISTMSVSNNLRVMADNSRAVVDLGVGGVALGGEGLLTLLNICGVHHSLADRARNLARVLDWLLVALPVLLVVALRPSGVSRLCLALTMSIASMSMSHYLGVMAYYSRAVVHLLRGLLAVGGDDVLALLYVSGVHNHIILLVAFLALLLDWLLVTLLVWLAEALEIVVLIVTIARLSFSLSFTLVVSNMAVSEYM